MFFVLLVVPVLFAFLPFMASAFFASPIPHGIYSFDALLLLIMMLIPCTGNFKQRVFPRIPFFVGAFLLLILSKSLDELFYALSIIIFFAFFSLPYVMVRKIFFVLASFTIILCDWKFFFYETFSQSLCDVWKLACYYVWGVPAFILVLALQICVICFFARKIFSSKIEKPIYLSFIALFVLGLDCTVHGVVPSISVVDYPVKKIYWENFTPEMLSRNTNLYKETRESFRNVYDREPAIDTEHKTVMVLLESFGVNHNNDFTHAMIESVSIPGKTVDGVMKRFTSNTQGAEWKDFHYTPDGGRTLVQEFKNNGFATFFVHGFKGDFYERNTTYPKVGFDSLFFYDQLKDSLSLCNYGFEGICDSSMTKFIATLLDDPKPKFVYWTTLDSHPPYEGQVVESKPKKCEELALSELECLYYVRINNTLEGIKNLAEKYPDYRFIIRGDHRPMGSLQQPGFVASFYHEWVPIIIIN